MNNTDGISMNFYFWNNYKGVKFWSLKIPELNTCSPVSRFLGKIISWFRFVSIVCLSYTNNRSSQHFTEVDQVFPIQDFVAEEHPPPRPNESSPLIARVTILVTRSCYFCLLEMHSHCDVELVTVMHIGRTNQTQLSALLLCLPFNSIKTSSLGLQGLLSWEWSWSVLIHVK